MGYKILGYLVWRGGKWYARRRLQGARRTAAISAVGALVLAGLLGASRQRAAQRS
ncbi:MAG TPA: hypothetical protein VGH93_03560 [Solirubrobacteraceae bacterium]|jgi:hypothetical protein